MENILNHGRFCDARLVDSVLVDEALVNAFIAVSQEKSKSYLRKEIPRKHYTQGPQLRLSSNDRSQTEVS